MLNLDKFCPRKTKSLPEPTECKTKPENNVLIATYEGENIFYQLILWWGTEWMTKTNGRDIKAI